MFEKYLKSRKNELLDKIKTDKPYVFIRDIVAAGGIDRAYKTYFDAEADWWIYEERVLRRTHPNFDMNDEEAREVISELESLLRKKARISKSEMGYIVQDAIKARMNYLVRPRTTLKWFIFRGEPTKPFVEIIKRMNYFYDYQYFYDGVLRWAEDTGMDKNSERLMSIDEFTRLIDTTDNNKIYDMSLEEFVDLLAPVFSFFGETDEDGQELIPIEALILFLDDKGINPLASELEDKRREDDVKLLSRRQIIDFYNSMLNQFDKGFTQKNDEEEPQPDEITESDQTVEEMADITADEPQPMDMPEEESTEEPETSGEPPKIQAEPPVESTDEPEPVDIPEIEESMEETADITADEPQPMDMPEEIDMAEAEPAQKTSAEMAEEQGAEHVDSVEELAESAGGEEDFDNLINQIENLPKASQPETSPETDKELLSEIENLNASLAEGDEEDEKKNANDEMTESDDVYSQDSSEVMDNLDKLLEEDMDDENMPDVEVHDESDEQEEPEAELSKSGLGEESGESGSEDVDYVAELKELFGDMPEDELKNENVDETTRAFQESYMNMLHYDKKDKFIYSSPDFPSDIIDSEIIDIEKRGSEDDNDNDDEDFDNLASKIK